MQRIGSDKSTVAFGIISLMTTFILDAVIAHNIYKSRSEQHGELLTAFHILSLGLLRPIFLFALRNKKEQVPASN